MRIHLSLGPSASNEDDLPGYGASKPGLSRHLTPPLSSKFGKLVLLQTNKSEKLQLLPEQEKPILKHSHEMSSLQESMRNVMAISNNAKMSLKTSKMSEKLRINDEKNRFDVILEDKVNSINPSFKSERLRFQQSVGDKNVPLQTKPNQTKLKRLSQPENRNQIRSVDPNFRI